MSSSPLPADRQHLVYARYTTKLKAQLRSLITEDLIDEHRRQPLGQHSDGLERVLNFFRRPPSYGLYSRVPLKEYVVIRLPIAAGADPEPIDDIVYSDENAAMHAVFRCHVEDLMRDSGA
jgi:branched-chain amino acid transport system permease protein